MPLYKLRPGFRHYENGQRMKAGETLEMTEERYINANLNDRFTLVGSEVTEDKLVENDWSFIKNKKQQEVLDLIAGVEDKEVAAKIYEAEEASKNRDKVLEAAEAKYKELGGTN